MEAEDTKGFSVDYHAEDWEEYDYDKGEYVTYQPGYYVYWENEGEYDGPFFSKADAKAHGVLHGGTEEE